MDFIILENYKNMFFIDKEANTLQMKVLSEFLVITVTRFADHVINSLKNKGLFVGDSHFVEKFNGQVVVENSWDETFATILPTEKLVQLLDKWNKLLKLSVWPKQAIITMGDDYNFEIKYELNGVEKII